MLKRKLALKKYYEARIIDYEQEKKLIEQFLQNVNKLEHRADDLLAPDSKYHKLLSQVLIPNTWETEKFETNPYCPEHLIHNTFSGIKVRSKSETIIANELFTNRIPFRYECKLMLDGGECYPDFTIKNPKTDKLVYWEHMGMMDEEDYRFKALDKIDCYIRNDIVPDVNLILTYETKTHPLDSSLVQKLIMWHFM